MLDGFERLVFNTIPGMQFKPRMCQKSCDRKKNNMRATLNISSLIGMRTLGFSSLNSTLMSNFGTKQMIINNLFTEEQIHKCCDTDKIFSSLWLDDRQILYGTKCKKLKILDVLTKNVIQIPTLKGSHENYHAIESPCGMHFIQVNPSRTLLATGANSSANVAVYRLPSLEPVCVGEDGHGDWVFDIIWLDDEFFAAGGRDSKVSLWQLSDNGYKRQKPFPSHSYLQPIVSQKCHTADKIRALAFSKKHLELVALSVNGGLHVWDVHSFKQKQSSHLPFQSENVCLKLHEKRNCYAIGSKSHVMMMDADTLVPTFEIIVGQPGCSVRSLSFNDDLITIGTGIGTVMFYDLRARQYIKTVSPNDLSDSPDLTSNAKLTTSSGVVKQNLSFWSMYHTHEDYRPAIYTHSYDSSGTRLFLAGGPLPTSLQGCYLGLWQ